MAEHHKNNHMNASSSVAAAADADMATAIVMAIDGSEEDSVLSGSQFLSREEVLKRRTRRLKQLVEIYKEYYWALMEELKLKYREYYWDYGKSPFVQEEDDDHHHRDMGNNSVPGTATLAPEDNQNSKLGSGSGLGTGSGNTCEVHGCKMKAMALTRFCHAHILSDAKQKLYKGCTYVTKSSTTGPTFCMKPILRAAVPSLCSVHLQKAEKHVTRALRKAGLNVTSTSKLAPKFHVVVAEYVRQIQSKRRAAQKALGDALEKKEGDAN
ncbi:uncharacterized protein LOC127806182 [Diospyros lotus]|uniref:uncharacterized protein LOC127806182 n=1 Tax=Diospyros lotus TaxID=55363 RepID=UPI00224E36CA|nr:uncharacterized protein LOC127806182 [Diospyros lotus]XP_052199260.1 uncharacterized protein LOC127806182 [Diospyros lotus]XP_052199261.1 uncharacterized protein LOC127806182 [Diospyros lotus]